MWVVGLVVLLIGVIAIWFFLSRTAANIAELKGYDRTEWFHICFWFGLFGFLLVIALPDLKLREALKTAGQGKANPSSETPEKRYSRPIVRDENRQVDLARITPMFALEQEEGWRCKSCNNFNKPSANKCCRCGCPRR